MDLTADVCTYNRAESLAGTLTALDTQGVPHHLLWELVVVNNNSRDRIRDVVDGAGQEIRAPVTYVLELRQGLSWARNTGIARARGEIIAFTDDNALPAHHGPGTPLLPAGLIQRIQRGLAARLRPVPPDHFRRVALRRFLVDNRVEAVLAEYGPTAVELLDICQGIGIPLIVHFHGYDVYSTRILDRYGSRYPRLFSGAAAVVAVSRAMVDRLTGLGAPSAKVHCIPSGADHRLFAGGSPGEAPPVFVAVGRFVDKKAPHLTLLAFDQALRAVPQARLLMVGDGPLREACLQLARVLGIAASVELLDPRPPHEVAALMRGARAFVQHSIQTSYGDAEGTPVSVLEAGATGLPVIATRHMGIQDVVVHEETGLLVDGGDVVGMAQAMVRLGRDPALAAALVRAGQDRVRSRYTREGAIRALWALIEDSLGRARPGATEGTLKTA